ncbi:MAG: type IV pilin N-terminal domain-containing protein [Methanomassiliicoccales archaeon]
MKKFNKKLGRSRSGVSDIIGNLLILAITVTLFSSIMFYVANMPEPAEATFTDLEPSLSNVQDDDTIWVNVTHKGGQTLKDWSTGIYIFVNGSLVPGLSVGDGNVDGDWSTGEVWRYKVPFVNEITGLSIMIVDMDTNSIVWQTDLLGGVTDIQLPPIIGTRYTSPSPGLENRSMVLYVQVMDPNDDNITSVSADMAALGLGSKTLVKVSQNLYTVQISDKAMYSWDNRKIIIFATDDTGLTSNALMTIHVNPASNGGGGGGGETGDFGQFDISGLQGFAIFERLDWEENGFEADRKNVFVKGDEDAVVVLITKTVVNTQGKNQLLVMDASTKVPVATVSSPTNVFKYHSFVAGFYVYNATIVTDALSGNYSISSTITDSKSVSDTFTMNSWIFVADYSGENLGYPKFKIFKDSAYSIPWTHFSVSDSQTNKIYIEIETSTNNPYIQGSGNIEIRDFIWNTQIRSSPASPTTTTTTTGAVPTNWNGPVSNLWQYTPPTTGVYRLVINLANVTAGAQWVPGDNAYVLRFDVFRTTSESYLLNTLVYIDAPTTKYDIVAALPSALGAAWAVQASLFYYQNDNSWTPPSVLEQTYDRDALNPFIWKVEAGDINDDGLGDFVAIVAYMKNKNQAQEAYPMVYYSVRGGGWIKTVLPGLGVTSKPADLSVDIGNIDQDDDLDMAITFNGAVYVYRNDGAWSRTMVENGITLIKGVRLADMDAPSVVGNDPQRSKDIVLVTSSTLHIYPNLNGAGTYSSAQKLTLAASTGSTTIQDWAQSEENLLGVVTGTFEDTKSEANPLFYEQITEEIKYSSLEKFPSPTSPAADDNTSDPITDLEIDYEIKATPELTNESRYFTILPDMNMNLTGWDATNLNLPTTNLVYTLIVNYTGSGYAAGEYAILEWRSSSSSPYQELSRVSNGDNYSEAIVTLANPADLININVRLNNTGLSGTVDIDYLVLNITYPEYSGLEHIWRFEATPGTAYTFNLFSAMSASTDGETYSFQYKIGAGSWTPIVTVSSTTFTSTITSLGNDMDGTVYIRVIDNVRTYTALNNDYIRVGQMYIQGTATLTKIGSSIQAFDIADVDGNGANDIVASTVNGTNTNRGDIWVLYNRDNYVGDPPVLMSGIFVADNIKPVLTNNANIASNVRWIEVGRFFNNWNTTFLDLVVGIEDTIETDKAGTTASTIYGIKQNSLGSFSALFIMSGAAGFLGSMDVNVMLGEDIDGNGRTDLLFGNSDGTIVLWANYGGTTSVTTWAGYTWQRYLIDTLGGPIYDLSAGAFTA